MPKQSQNNFVYLSNNQIQAKYHFIVAYKQILLLFIVQTLRTNELKVWTVLSTDDIYSTKCSLSYLVQ